MKTEERIMPADARQFIFDVLCKENVNSEGAANVADGLVHASLRGVDSHGIRLLPHYLKALQAGRINPQPNYRFEQTAPATGILDADHAFGHDSGMQAVRHAISIAKESGAGCVGVRDSTHFGAASFFGLAIAEADMIGLSFTHSDSLIVPTAGKQRFLGNNPICFTAPCKGEDPVCLDMATSVITFNKVLQLREENATAPAGVGVDAQGRETCNPHDIVNLMPVGGYKGYGLSLMIEVLCALLTGMPYGPHIPRMYDAPIQHRRHLGHFFMALRIDPFADIQQFKSRMKEMVDELRRATPVDERIPVMVAGDPEKQTAAKRCQDGLPLRDLDADYFRKAALDYGVSLKIR